jgi:predicted ester cyclase
LAADSRKKERFPMSTAGNQAIVLRLIHEYFNQKHEVAWDELVHPDVVIHGVTGVLHGSAAAKAYYANVLFRSFPNLHCIVDDVIAAGDKVVLRLTESGTMRGSLMDMPPTGQRFRVAAVQIAQLAEGKLVAMWGLRDTSSMMRQLGLTQPPASAVDQ